MKEIEHHSPEFKLKKFNNYDNTIRNASRNMLESFDLDKNIPVAPPKFLVSFFFKFSFFLARC